MRTTFTFFILFVVSLYAAGQDILVKRNGDEINAKVLRITSGEITYRLTADPLDSAAATVAEQSIARGEVFMIKYGNGTKEVFDDENPDDEKLMATLPVSYEPPLRRNNMEMYQRGKIDAMSYYRGYKGAATGTMIVSLLSPLAGLAPAIACSAAPPQERSLQYPSYDHFKDANYQHAYRQQARRMKVGRVWRSWGIGLGVNLALAVILAQ